MMLARLALASACATLALAGCGANARDRSHGQPPGTARRAPVLTPADGAMALFRAQAGPILCEYAGDLQGTEQALTKAAQNAGGAINASAPESAQQEYASAMRGFADVLERVVRRFRKVNPPAEIASPYESFIASLKSVGAQARRAASYAAQRNYAEIAAMENLSTPSSGEGVFRQAGITGCPTQAAG
jgi:hypothetical protein